MDRVISHPHDIDSNGSCNGPHPPRPASRLGFNNAEVLKCPPNAPAGVDAGQWTRSLFQNGPITELRLESIKSPTMDGAVTVCAPHTQNAGVQPTGEADNHHATSQCTRNELPSPPRKSPSVSRLCFPFVTTSTPRRAKQPPPPTRHKYSCFPTLLSPTPAGRPFPAQPRHKYHQHGYSRTALQNLKWFWSTREETWDGASVNAKAYGGIVEVAPRTAEPQPTTTKMPARALAPEPDSDSNVDCVYPRRGDIAALRDPYCADIDRCFSNLPVWTMNKTLWMHDVHMATQMRAVEDEGSDEEEDGVETEEETEDDEDGELESLSSTHFSDDSDATLVESESDAEASTAISVFGIDDDDDIDIGATSTSGGLHQKGKVPTIVYADQILPKVAPNREGWPRCTTATAMKVTGKTDIKFRPTTYQWPTDWYRRWDVLVDLSRQNGAEANSSCIRGSPPPHLLSGPRPAGSHESTSCTQ